MTSSRCAALCGAVLAIAASTAAAQPVKAHMEACTRWGYASGEFGTRNSCDIPVLILFMALGDRQMIEREVAPGAWFGSAADLSAGWMFTACPTGYAPNPRFRLENKNAIIDSLYNCLPARPDA